MDTGCVELLWGYVIYFVLTFVFLRIACIFMTLETKQQVLQKKKYNRGKKILLSANVSDFTQWCFCTVNICCSYKLLKLNCFVLFMTSRCGVRSFAFTDGVIVWRLYLCRKHVQYEQRLSEQFLSTSSHSSNSVSEAGLKSQTKYFTLIVFIGPLCSVDISSHQMLLIVFWSAKFPAVFPELSLLFGYRL